MKPLLSRSLLTVTVGCALACLPYGQASAQDSPPAADATSAGTPSPGQTDTQATAPGKPVAAEKKLSPKEVEFIKKAGAGNDAEVKVGELAASNGESQEVKDFGTQMQKDHGEANTDLEAVAKEHDVAFPPKEMEKQKMMYEKLSKLHGAEFDKAYVTDMLEDHEQDLAEYKAALSSTKDSALKAYVEKVEPIVAEHLKAIKEIKSKMTNTKNS